MARGMSGLTNAHGKAGIVVLLCALALSVQACTRSPYKLTECVNGEPAVPRIHDVAPPNC
ncbi:hypothetical protein LV82_02605 [Albidovulum inexpectatum]|uniref:Uncharacterized protein n=2 Tax=Albidovulum inexpectatum TaxID=196587 RepID=A0A2S5JEC3_9RHOB|nr:hypothetical protein LV82_02605 [Albidovulum inexpectatum]